MNKDESKRTFHEVRGKNKLIYLVENYLDKRKAYIKGLPREYTITLDLIPDQQILRLKFNPPLPREFHDQYEITVYAVVKRYVEITLKKLHYEDGEGEYKFIKANIAQEIRQEPRVDVTKQKYKIDKFRLTKYSIRPNMDSSPIPVQITFEKVKPQIYQELPTCTLHTFDNIKSSKLIPILYENQKVIYIKNTIEADDDENLDTSFINLKEYLDYNKYYQEIKTLKDQNIRSLLLYPVIYYNIRGEATPVGYFRMVSNNQSIDLNVMESLGRFSQLITDDIRDSTVHYLNESQKVINVSKRGLQIIVSDDDCIKAFLENREEMVLDVNVNEEQTISLIGRTAGINLINDLEYLVGIQLIEYKGNNSLALWDKIIESLYENITLILF